MASDRYTKGLSVVIQEMWRGVSSVEAYLYQVMRAPGSKDVGDYVTYHVSRITKQRATDAGIAVVWGNESTIKFWWPLVSTKTKSSRARSRVRFARRVPPASTADASHVQIECDRRRLPTPHVLLLTVDDTR